MSKALLNRLRQDEDGIRGLLFDKDGTLIRLDDLWIEPTINFIEELFAKDGNDTDPDQVKKVIEALGIVDGKLIANSLVSAGTIKSQAEFLSDYVSKSAEEIADEMSDYFTDYLEANPEKIVPVCDLPELFQELKMVGYVIGLVTSDSRKPTEKALEILGITRFFDFIATADDYREKPDPEALIAFAQEGSLSLSEILYVGDSFVDMEFGSYSGGAVGVLTGNTTRQELKGKASYIIDSIDLFFEI